MITRCNACATYPCTHTAALEAAEEEAYQRRIAEARSGHDLEFEKAWLAFPFKARTWNAKEGRYE
jgi:hypothetical protein